jgi:hypothetical protein
MFAILRIIRKLRRLWKIQPFRAITVTAIKDDAPAAV